MLETERSQAFPMKNLTFSFDIGYASIGWAVISAEKEHPEKPLVEGTGVVLFESDSCLASKRRAFRRMRRTIRARRKRIDRIGAILQQSGIITEEERKQTGHPAPFLLAARALQGKIRLSGKQIWDLMRWYAHNRGYDNNCAWARTEDETEEDTAKLALAKEQMAKCRTSTMAETVTLLLGLSADDEDSKFTCQSPAYKNMGMAFPRKAVVDEVENLLYHHADIPTEVADLIFKEAAPQKEKLAEYGVRFPLRYIGSVLFGQLKPRFDNRIIARCPITWAAEYRKSLDAGLDETKAKQHADKMAKVPNADCADFYRYRFARILANLRVNGEPVSADIRQALMEQAVKKGRYTKTEFIKVFEELVQTKDHNLRNYFQITPDADKALVLVPLKKEWRAGGRAPYARPVLRQVVEEVLRGEDPTRPAYSLKHLNGEKKEADGVLYALSDPESDVSRIQAARRIDAQTNNHMVRHRMLIFERLLADMVKKYAENDSTRVTQCCIEVARELKEFSGMTAKQIEKEMSAKLRSFHSAVKYLEERRDALPGGVITGGLIRKCRIAMDMGWKCPYTGVEYSVKDLPLLEREHIVPHAARNTNAMAALVLTWPEINRMKGKRTALEFIREFQTQSVEGRENLSIMTEHRFTDFVKKLNSTKGSPDDVRRCRARKRLLMVEKTPQQGDAEGLGFTEGQLTQSSQLMRLASQVAKKKIKGATISMIPGYVTAETRKSWNTLGALVAACPEIVDEESGKLRDKESIRNITHLHHAVDAATLGLVLHLIPAGNNGIVWQAIGKRRLNEHQLRILRNAHALGAFHVDSDRCLHLKDIPQGILDSLSEKLKERRVIRHIPADMSGARLDEQYKGIKRVKNGVVTLRARGGKKAEEEKTESKLIGLAPGSKLRAMKAALVISDNYGLVLDPEPKVIPHVSVYKQLQECKRANGGRPVRILRQGQLIRLTAHSDAKRNTVWRIVSIKNNKTGIAFDLQIPDAAISGAQTHPKNWINARLATILQSGLEVIQTGYTA